MPRAKTNLSKKTRMAQRMSIARKKLTPEQLDERRKMVAAQKALKRSQETPEEHATRIRRTARERRERRSKIYQKEKQLRQQAVLAAIEKRQKKEEEKEEMQIKIAVRQLVRGECIVKKLHRKLKHQTKDIEDNTTNNTVTVSNVQTEFSEVLITLDPDINRFTSETQDSPSES